MLLQNKTIGEKEGSSARLKKVPERGPQGEKGSGQGVMAPDLFTQVLKGLCCMFFYREGRNVQPATDLFVFKPFFPAKLEHQFLLRGKFFHACFQHGVYVFIAEQCMNIVCTGGDFPGNIHQDQRFMGHSLQAVEHMVFGDAEDPGIEVGDARKLFSFRPYFNKHFLQHIFCRLPGIGKIEYKEEKLLVILMVQGCKSLYIVLGQCPERNSFRIC